MATDIANMVPVMTHMTPAIMADNTPMQNVVQTAAQFSSVLRALPVSVSSRADSETMETSNFY